MDCMWIIFFPAGFTRRTGPESFWCAEGKKGRGRSVDEVVGWSEVNGSKLVVIGWSKFVNAKVLPRSYLAQTSLALFLVIWERSLAGIYSKYPTARGFLDPLSINDTTPNPFYFPTRLSSNSTLSLILNSYFDQSFNMPPKGSTKAKTATPAATKDAGTSYVG